jgi:hypothetical protein
VLIAERRWRGVVRHLFYINGFSFGEVAKNFPKKKKRLDVCFISFQKNRNKKNILCRILKNEKLYCAK